MFSYGPFSHTGLKLDFSISDDISLMLGVFNQTDQTEANYDRYTAFGAQLGSIWSVYKLFGRRWIFTNRFYWWIRFI